MLGLNKLKPYIHWIKFIGIYRQPVAIVAAEDFQNGVQDKDIHVHENHMLTGSIGFEGLQEYLLPNVLVVISVGIPADKTKLSTQRALL